MLLPHGFRKVGLRLFDAVGTPLVQGNQPVMGGDGAFSGALGSSLELVVGLGWNRGRKGGALGQVTLDAAAVRVRLAVVKPFRWLPRPLRLARVRIQRPLGLQRRPDQQ